MRLIDADALKAEISKEWFVEPNATIFNYVFNVIDNAPTVEAVPLEHHNKIKGIMDNEIKSLVDILDNERPQGDLISRQDAIDALEEQLDYLRMLNKDENPTAEGKWYGVNWARNTIADLPSAQKKGGAEE